MPQDSPSRRQDQFIVRFPDGMRDRIAEVAKANNRSMNSEIVARLEGTLSDDAPATVDTFKKYIEALIEKVEQQNAIIESRIGAIEESRKK